MMMIVVWLVLILYQRDLGLDSTDIFSQASAAHPTIDPLAFVFTLIMIGMKVGMVMVMSIMLSLMMVMMMMVVMIVVVMMVVMLCHNTIPPGGRRHLLARSLNPW